MRVALLCAIAICGVAVEAQSLTGGHEQALRNAKNRNEANARIMEQEMEEGVLPPAREQGESDDAYRKRYEEWEAQRNESRNLRFAEAVKNIVFEYFFDPLKPKIGFGAPSPRDSRYYMYQKPTSEEADSQMELVYGGFLPSGAIDIDKLEERAKEHEKASKDKEPHPSEKTKETTPQGAMANPPIDQGAGADQNAVSGADGSVASSPEEIANEDQKLGIPVQEAETDRIGNAEGHIVEGRSAKAEESAPRGGEGEVRESKDSELKTGELKDGEYEDSEYEDSEFGDDDFRYEDDESRDADDESEDDGAEGLAVESGATHSGEESQGNHENADITLQSLLERSSAGSTPALEAAKEREMPLLSEALAGLDPKIKQVYMIEANAMLGLHSGKAEGAHKELFGILDAADLALRGKGYESLFSVFGFAEKGSLPLSLPPPLWIAFMAMTIGQHPKDWSGMEDHDLQEILDYCFAFMPMNCASYAYGHCPAHKERFLATVAINYATLRREVGFGSSKSHAPPRALMNVQSVGDHLGPEAEQAAQRTATEEHPRMQKLIEHSKDRITPQLAWKLALADPEVAPLLADLKVIGSNAILGSNLHVRDFNYRAFLDLDNVRLRPLAREEARNLVKNPASTLEPSGGEATLSLDNILHEMGWRPEDFPTLWDIIKALGVRPEHSLHSLERILPLSLMDSQYKAQLDQLFPLLDKLWRMSIAASTQLDL